MNDVKKKPTKLIVGVVATIIVAATLAISSMALADNTEAPIFEDNIIKGSIELNKHDIETGSVQAQGDGTLEGAVFTIYNKSAHAVTINGKNVSVNGIVGTMITNDDGYASFKNLPYGTYSIRETEAPRGYTAINDEYTVQIRENGKIYKVGTGIINETIKRGNLSIIKNDSDNLGSQPLGQGTGTLAGMQVSVTNASNNPIIWNGKTYQPNEQITTLTSNAEGRLTMENLPFGRYTLQETVAPEGYNVNESWVETITIS